MPEPAFVAAANRPPGIVRKPGVCGPEPWPGDPWMTASRHPDGLALATELEAD
jgi:hypothetical protein